jgi:hypothetical protein
MQHLALASTTSTFATADFFMTTPAAWAFWGAAITYASMADLCAPPAAAALADDFALTDSTALQVLRYALHNGLTAHDGARHYYERRRSMKLHDDAALRGPL